MFARRPASWCRFALLLTILALAGIASACGGAESPAPAEEPPSEPAAEATAPASVVAPGAAPELVQDGFSFTEGPVFGPDGNLYFSDVRESRIHRVLPDGTVEVYLENTDGANGLAFDDSGRLIAAQGAGGQVGAFDADGNVTVLAEGTAEDPYRPNDLILDGRGGIYFTDPGQRGTPEAPATRSPRVWYITPEGETVLVTDAAGRANGITLTLDGSTLILADSDGPDVLAMDVAADGTASNLRSWASLEDIPAGERSGADGMAVDADGRLYVTTVAGVQVFDPDGVYLETIQFPQQASNVAFGGPDRTTLYATARTGVYSLRMATAGPADRAK